MIEKIIGATIVPDIQALAWADQIGYMVKPWTKSVETKDGFKDIVYPVAEFVTTEDCQVQDYGLNVLTTDKGYTSLILISAEGDMTSEIATNIPQRRAVNIEQDIKITVWMNNHKGATHIAKAELMKALFNIKYEQVAIQWPYIGAADTDYDIFVNTLRVRFVREINGTPFNEYTFSKDQAQFHNNYSAFGFVFKLSGLIFPNCLPAYPTLDVDACETISANPVTAYHDLIHTQKTSHRAGDEGYRLVNGLFELNNPSIYDRIQKIDPVAATPYITLAYNNEFGTTDRFTDIDGLQVYADGIVVDHLTKRMYTQGGYGLYNWSGAIDAGLSCVVGGFTDWYLITRPELESVIGMENFLDGIGSGSVITFATNKQTSTSALDSTFAYSYNAISDVTARANKTNTSAYPIFVRIFSVNDLNI